jgi:uncharacterized protein (TIGR03067 family)
MRKGNPSLFSMAGLLLASLLAVLPIRAGDSPAPSDQQRIEGAWVCVATLKEGRQVNDFVGVKAVMKGDRLTWHFPQADGTFRKQEAVFSIDPSQNPKHYDWHLVESPQKIHRRLYVLEGDTLLWADDLVKPERPESFSNCQYQYVMQRVRQ